MFGLTPFERKNYDIFNAFDDFDREFFGDDRMRRPIRPIDGMNPMDAMRSAKNIFCTDIQDKGNEYVLEAELPGFKKEDINIDISRDCLTISASHEENNDEKNEDGKFIRRERYSGKYRRSFGIEGIDADKISAGYTDGILRINMPKKAENQNETRKLEIN